MRIFLFFFFSFFLLMFGNTPNIFAFDQDAVAAIHQVRPDLQAAFDANGVAIPGTAAGFLIDIYDWAEQYGWREHEELYEYAPDSYYVPELVGSAAPSEVSASSYIIFDKNSRQILAAEKAGLVWPVASLTKLVTADVVLDSGVDLDGAWSVLNSDNVGGARLWVEDSTQFTIEDLFYGTLVGSANNAANALSRSTGLSSSDFIYQMNRRPFELGLSYTEFVDPTGIELGNVSTAREIARVAFHVFGSHPEVRQYTTTASCYIHAITDGSEKYLKNTNWMLYYPEYDDVYVTSGKTGYLIESGWNLVVQLRPDAYQTEKELLLVLFGSSSRSDSFIDAEVLANWVWDNYQWTGKQ